MRSLRNPSEINEILKESIQNQGTPQEIHPKSMKPLRNPSDTNEMLKEPIKNQCNP